MFAARRRAADADVVVVNHHLLASDLAVRGAAGNWQEAAVLPPYRRLVLDEAHHLEDTAADHLGAQATSRGVERLLSRLERGNRGVLPALRSALATDADEVLREAALEVVNARVAPALAEARRAAELLFRLLDTFLAGKADNVVRLTDGFADDPVWAAGLGDALDGFGYALSLLKDALLALMDRLGTEAEPVARIESLVAELRGIASRLEGARDAVRAALRPPAGAPLTVRWVERRGGSHVALSAVPLELAPLLRDLLFDRVETIVLTSATLAAGGSFDFLAGRLGLDLAPACAGAREVLPSPFNYRDQCLFAIPDDVPEPRDDVEAPRRARGRDRGGPRARLGRRPVRAVHQPSRAARGRGGAPRPPRRGRPLAAAGAGRGAAGPAAARASATRARPSCSAPTRSGRAWTCRARRCARCCWPSCPSACPPSRSRRRAARRSRRPAATRSTTTWSRSRPSSSSRASAA